MSSIDGKRALVTGGAAGIGKVTAEALARRGAKLILVDRDRAGLDAAARAVERHTDCATVVADLTDVDAIYAAVREAEAAFGGVDLLINNAGYVKGGPLVEVEERDHTRTIELNVLGVTRMTRAVLPGMIARGHGHIVNIASAAGLTGVALQTTYSASKWAVVGFTEALAYELEALGHPIEVSCICPSFVNTGMFHGAKPPHLVPMLEPSDVANGIIDAIRHNKRLVALPKIIGVVPAVRGFFTARARGRIADLLGVNTSMKGWRGH